MSQKNYNKLSTSEQKKEDWMNAKWRPMMGWSYMLTCVADFVLFPILWSILQSISHGQVNIQWQPITLQGAGLYHIAMGAILGITAYGRTQEKLNGANNGGLSLIPPVGSSYVPPTSAPTSFTQTLGQSTNKTPFGTADISAPIITSFKGKPAPIQPDQPEI